MNSRRHLVLLAAMIAVITTSCSEVPTDQRNDPSLPRGNVAVEVEEGSVQAAVPVAIDEAFEMQGIRFRVESPNSFNGNSVTVTPSGLEVSNEAFTVPANGQVIDAEIGDLNGDRSPELYVFVRQLGTEGKVDVIGYGTNSRKSMSVFELPEPDVAAKEYAGYIGNDEFEIVNNVLFRRFPIYRTEGVNAVPTGKTRLVQYKIRPGEATWRFYVVRSDEF